MKTYLVIAALFIIYAGLFIQASSFIAIDGQRYYTIADDGLISMRYAWNLSHGNGLVWNRGEKVEGITNPLFTILCSVITGHVDKRNSILIVQIIAIVTLLGIALTFKKIAENLKLNNVVATLLFITPLIYYPLFYWTMRGMEVGLLSLFVSMALLFFIKNQIRKCTIALIIAFLVRPDIVIAMIIFGIFIFISRKKEFKQYTVLCISALVLTETWRYLYYGQLMPNTYILKMTGMNPIDRIRFGFQYDIYVMKDTGWIYLTAFISLLFIKYRYKVLLFGLPLAMYLYLVYCGGDAFKYCRIIAPYVPILFICIAQAISNINKWIVIALFSLLLIYPYTTKIFSKHEREGGEEINITLAILLNKVLPINASVGVLWGGCIPYYTDFYAIDFLGKCDPYIANLPPDTTGAVTWGGMKSVPGHNKYDLNYSIGIKHPTYIQTYCWGRQNVFPLIKSNYMMCELPFSVPYMPGNGQEILIRRRIN
jgi:hypothetical protein